MGKNKVYVSTVGTVKTIHKTWGECEKKIKGVKGGTCKGYETEEEAYMAMREEETGEDSKGEHDRIEGEAGEYQQSVEQEEIEKERENCPKCRKKVSCGVLCDNCQQWWHYKCQSTTKENIEEEYGKLKKFECTKCVEKRAEEDRKKKEEQIVEMEKMIYEMQKEKDSREDIIKKVKTENRLLKTNIEKIEEERENMNAEIVMLNKDQTRNRNQGENEKKDQEISEMKKQIEEIRRENEQLKGYIQKSADDKELEEKIKREEKKKIQKEIERLKKETSRQFEALEEERMEKTRWERKAIQMEENYKEAMMINEKLERAMDDNTQRSQDRVERINREERRRGNQQGESQETRNKEKEGKERDGKRTEDERKKEGQIIIDKGKICLWHAKGKICKFGRDCQFQHKKMCKWTRMGEVCRRNHCMFSHDETVMCKWDREEDGCKSGTKCKFIHTRGNRNGEVSNKDDSKVKNSETTKTNEDTEEQKREEEINEDETNREKTQTDIPRRNTQIGKNKGRNEIKYQSDQGIRRSGNSENDYKENDRQAMDRKINEMEERMIKKITEMMNEKMENVRSQNMQTQSRNFWQEPDQNYYQQNNGYGITPYNQIQYTC